MSLDWLKRTLTSSWTGNPSSKRLVYVSSAFALIFAMFGIMVPCAYWIAKNGDIGAGAVSAWVAVLGAVAGLAGAGYHKKEVGLEGPPVTGDGARACVDSPALSTKAVSGDAKIGGTE